MKTPHAPSPWSIDQPRLIIQDSEKNAIARIVSEVGKPINEANARLIAVAPKMYEFILKIADSGNEEAKSIIQEIYG